MKAWHKYLLGALALVLLVGTGLVGFVSVRADRRYDDVAGPDLRVSTDPEVLGRGKYLVRGPAHCITCHVSGEDIARADAGEEVAMRGGMVFELGPVGRLVTPNLTPDARTGIGRYSDRQLFRMMRHLIKPDGSASLWPLMPFHQMGDDDLVAVVSYLRSLDPVENEVPRPHYTLLGKALRATNDAFQPRIGHEAPARAPAEAATVERGEYLARYVANCRGCHTNHDLRTMTWTGPEFAGGAVFNPEPADPELWYRAPNLTPHPSGVLVNYPSVEVWIARFRAGRALPGSPMHWGPFSRMSDADLEALWLYFNTLEPVDNDVGATAFRQDS
jgi:mono/diheme cytochrome c family protein